MIHSKKSRAAPRSPPRANSGRRSSSASGRSRSGTRRRSLAEPYAHQASTAEELKAAIDANRAPIVHLVRFPRIDINHAVLLFAYRESAKGVEFSAYDPNAPDAAVPLAFDGATRTFVLERNAYFAGGRVDVYEIYHRPLY